MRGIWAGSVTLLLALGTADAGAQDVGAPHGMVDARAQSDASVPGAGAVGSGQAAAVSLGRPEPASSQRASDSMDAPADSQVRRAGYDPAATLDPPQPLVRGQSPDWPPPSPPPGVAPPVGALHLRPGRSPLRRTIPTTAGWSLSRPRRRADLLEASSTNARTCSAATAARAVAGSRATIALTTSLLR